MGTFWPPACTRLSHWRPAVSCLVLILIQLPCYRNPWFLLGAAELLGRVAASLQMTRKERAGCSLAGRDPTYNVCYIQHTNGRQTHHPANILHYLCVHSPPLSPFTQCTHAPTRLSSLTAQIASAKERSCLSQPLRRQMSPDHTMHLKTNRKHFGIS